MILFGSRPSRSALSIIASILLFPYKDLASPLIQNATNPHSNLAVECKTDISWVDVGYSSQDCRHVLNDFYLTLVYTMGRTPVEFIAQGHPEHPEMPNLALPAKFRYGTCTMFINFAGSQQSTVGNYRDLGHLASRIFIYCVGETRPQTMGWGIDVENVALGVWFCTTGSQLDIATSASDTVEIKGNSTFGLDKILDSRGPR